MHTRLFLCVLGETYFPKNGETHFPNAETCFQNAETHFPNAETHFPNGWNSFPRGLARVALTGFCKKKPGIILKLSNNPHPPCGLNVSSCTLSPPPLWINWDKYSNQLYHTMLLTIYTVYGQNSLRRLDDTIFVKYFLYYWLHQEVSVKLNQILCTYLTKWIPAIWSHCIANYHKIY